MHRKQREHVTATWWTILKNQVAAVITSYLCIMHLQQVLNYTERAHSVMSHSRRRVMREREGAAVALLFPRIGAESLQQWRKRRAIVTRPLARDRTRGPHACRAFACVRFICKSCCGHSVDCGKCSCPVFTLCSSFLCFKNIYNWSVLCVAASVRGICIGKFK